MNIQIKVIYFGAFRKYGSEAEMSIAKGMQLKDFKSLLSRDFQIDLGLLNDSALAFGTEVLLEDAVLNESGEIALLPPVCGG